MVDSNELQRYKSTVDSFCTLASVVDINSLSKEKVLGFFRTGNTLLAYSLITGLSHPELDDATEAFGSRLCDMRGICVMEQLGVVEKPAA